jgi:hypothetical protein
MPARSVIFEFRALDAWIRPADVVLDSCEDGRSVTGARETRVAGLVASALWERADGNYAPAAGPLATK